MKRAIGLVNERRDSKDIRSILGEVTISERVITPGNFENLTLGIKCSNPPEDRTFWVRGSHRVDCGEKVVVYFTESQSGPIVCEAYEILNLDGSVKTRYHERAYQFLEE